MQNRFFSIFWQKMEGLNSSELDIKKLVPARIYSLLEKQLTKSFPCLEQKTKTSNKIIFSDEEHIDSNNGS